MGERVKLLGWQDDLEALYGQASCYVLCSDSEGWGMAVIDALVFGVPVVMSDVGLAGEVVVNEESGLVVPVNDVPALAQAMLRVYDSRELRDNLIRGGQRALSKLPDNEGTWLMYMESWKKAIK